MTAADSASIRNHSPDMAYRRFGRTGRWLSCITLGGMRYHEGWGEPRNQPTTAMIDECAACTQLALDAGINHIETAHGYGKSEHCYGTVLSEVLAVPRQRYHLMTKGVAWTADEMRRLVEEQLTALRTDHIDLYAWHGLNNREKYDKVCRGNGPIEELRKMQDEGLIGCVGFSTHGPLEVIIDALATDLFDFVNLHFYYFLQRNRGAVDYAAAKDLGVFIISPNDKGGRLFEPSPRLRELCAPLTPIQFNAKWCLQFPQIQTLSFGMTRPEHFAEMRGIFPVHVPLSPQELAIRARLDDALLTDPASAYEGYELERDASGINIPEVLRHRRMWKCYDQEAFGHYRYNMFQEKGDWFPGHYATPDRVAQIDQAASPVELDLKAMISETHDRFYKPKDGK
jgi:predicted aldo/keto reductase-like oxidoreductase